MTTMTFDEWVTYGMQHSWCGPPVCETHDGTPMSLKEEEDLYDNGDDVCIHIMRLYAEPEQRLMVEDNHTPSQWRNDYGV
jgi:hypothetical protein